MTTSHAEPSPSASRPFLRLFRPRAASPRPAASSRLVPWVVSAVASLVVVSAMLVLSSSGQYTLTQMVMLIPAVVTIAMVPGAWRKSARWISILLIANIVYPAALALFLSVAFTWALHQTWVRERSAGQIRPALLARRKGVNP